MAPPQSGYGYQSMPMQGRSTSPTMAGMGGTGSLPAARVSQVEGPNFNQPMQSQNFGQPRTGLLSGLQAPSSQAGMRSLPVDRIQSMQMQQQQQQGGSVTGNTPPGSQVNMAAPPVMFQTKPVSQLQAQESVVDFTLENPTSVGAAEENEYLHSRVQELERSRREMEQQLSQYKTAAQNPQRTMPGDDVTSLQRRLREAQESEANALRAHEARLHEINELEEQIFKMRDEQGVTFGSSKDSTEHLLDLQRQLASAKAAEAAASRILDDQRNQLEEQAMVIARTRAMDAQHQEQHALQRDDKLALEQKFASVHREKETHKAIADQKRDELAELQAKQLRDTEALERKIAELTSTEDSYQRQLVNDRKQIAELQDQLDSESKAKGFHQETNQGNSDSVANLEGEVTYLRTVETFHKGQADLHRKEAFRLKRLRDEDAPPPFVPRMPYKALEERVIHLAIFMMMGLCALPVMGALAVLSDENYTFWMGTFWPYMVIGGCSLVFVIFCLTMHGLLQWALPEHRSQFTMAFTWATFAALLGVMLVPMALLANKEAMNIASTVSQGCLTAMPQSEWLVDYSQVLYNIRMSPACLGATSVTECQGWAANKYTNYLEYLEDDFHCGPLCPESPPPARAIVAPSMHNKALPTLKPTVADPPMFGPPLQNVHAAFLQSEHDLVGQQVQLHKHKGPWSPGGAAATQRTLVSPAFGIMETSLPHMQAQKLFSKGETRATCYPLIATRLQVLVSTFGGLWYWEGMGLIIISLLTSLYAGIYFAFGMTK